MNHKSIYVVLFISSFTSLLHGQHWVKKSGTVTIRSEAVINTLEGKTEKFDYAVDLKTKSILFSCDISSLEFKDPLILKNLSDHFLNLKEHPTVKFQGNISKLDEKGKTIQFNGILEINGKKKKIETKANWIIQEKEVILDFLYELKLADFDIDFPTVLSDSISEKILVKLNALLIEK